MSVDMSVAIGNLKMANPVMPASGTFSARLNTAMDLNRLGAFVTKTITTELRSGNPMPRVVERSSGMINAIGIPSKGLEYFLGEAIGVYREFSPPLVISISAPTGEGFASLAAELSGEGVDVIEANISCPNIEEDGKSFALRAESTYAVTRAMRAATSKPLWIKLSPNTGEMPEIAKAAEEAGADAVVVSNTILSMAIDLDSFRPSVGNVLGGLSGPAIKPIILRHVFQCAKVLDIPIIGCGGISTAEDAVEYLLAGASAVQVGTATFLQPDAITQIIDGMSAFCARRQIARVADLVGGVVLRDTDQVSASWTDAV